MNIISLRSISVYNHLMFFCNILSNLLQVALRCSLAKSYLARDDSKDETEQGLVISGSYIEGASLDLDKECLVEPT